MIDWGLGLRRALPVTLQTEATECGLACLSMIAGYYGYRTDLASLRRRFQVSLKGVRLTTLIEIANHLNFSCRPVRLELSDLSHLKLPCVLHWEFQHYVVLKSVGVRSVTIVDPARGKRRIPLSEVSKSFTGVALELWPNATFRPADERRRVRIRELVGRVTGLSRAVAQVLLLAMCLEVFALVSPFFLQWVIDHVLVSGDRDLLATLALGFGLLLILQQLISAVRAWGLIYLGNSLNAQWRSNLFAHMLRLPTQFFERRHVGDIVSRFTAIDSIQRTLTASLMEGILDGVMSVAMLVMLLTYSPKLAWVCMAAVTLYAAIRALFYPPAVKATEEQIVHAARQHSHFLETVRGVKSIKLSQRAHQRQAAWFSMMIDQINAGVRVERLQVVSRLSNGTLFGVENVLVVWLGAHLVLDGAFSVGMLMAFMAYKGQFASRISGLIDKCVQLRMLRLHGARLADIALAEPEKSSLRGRLVLSSVEGNDASVELRDVKFRYAEDESWILDGINLRINSGDAIAITGPSGCGKTTLLNILLGVVPPTHGEVLIGGTKLELLGSELVRSVTAAVTQDDALFEGTVADNICFFDPAADQLWIEECARLAAIHDDITAMPMGYNTLIGYLGCVLSGGQKQRVLLARALYRRPRILILDEATSHLDVQKEMMVNAALKQLQITRIVVAHRPQSLEAMDRLIRLDQSKLVEVSKASLPRMAG